MNNFLYLVRNVKEFYKKFIKNYLIKYIENLKFIKYLK